jgi:hypothetical protein
MGRPTLSAASGGSESLTQWAENRLPRKKEKKTRIIELM